MQPYINKPFFQNSRKWGQVSITGNMVQDGTRFLSLVTQPSSCIYCIDIYIRMTLYKYPILKDPI